MKKFIFTALFLSLSSLIFLGCSSHEEKAAGHRSDDVLWQQYKADKAAKSLDEE